MTPGIVETLSGTVGMTVGNVGNFMHPGSRAHQFPLGTHSPRHHTQHSSLFKLHCSHPEAYQESLSFGQSGVANGQNGAVSFSLKGKIHWSTANGFPTPPLRKGHKILTVARVLYWDTTCQRATKGRERRKGKRAPHTLARESASSKGKKKVQSMVVSQ